MSRLAFLLGLVTLVLLQTTNAGEEIMSLVKELCRRTDNYDFCVGSFIENMPPHPITPTEGLTKLSLRIATTSVTKTRRTIQKSVPGQKDKTVLQRLQGCDKLYFLAKKNIRSAKVSMYYGRFLEMKNFEKEAMKGEAGCNEIFKGAQQSHPVGTLSAQSYTLTWMSVLVAEHNGF